MELKKSSVKIWLTFVQKYNRIATSVKLLNGPRLMRILALILLIVLSIVEWFVFSTATLQTTRMWL